VPVLHVILVMVPPLLADLIRHVVVPRFEQNRVEQLARGIGDAPLVEFSIAADISDIEHIDTRVGLPKAQADLPQARVDSSEAQVDSPAARFGSPGARLGSSEFHVIILGPTAAAAPGAALVQRRNPRVLTLSADLTMIHGPEAGVSHPFTPDVLADLLLAISRTI